MQKRISSWAALAVILLLATGLRLHGIGVGSLSVDELGSLETAAGRGQIHLDLPRDRLLTPPPAVTRLRGGGSIADVPRLMNADVHPPLYFILLRIWQDIFGDGDVAARMLSILAAIAGVGLIFDIGRLLANFSTGVWAALLMALAQPEIIYSGNVRPYALVAALALGAMDTLLRIEKLGRVRDTIGGPLWFPPPDFGELSRAVLRGRARVGAELIGDRPPPQPSPGVPGEGEDRPPIASRTHLGSTRACQFTFFATLAAGALTHYFVLPAILAMGIYSLIRLRGSARTEVLICFAAAGGLVLVLWGHGLWVQRANFSDPWMYWFNDDIPNHVSQTWRRFAALPLRYLAEPPSGSGAAAIGAGVLYLLPWLLLRRKPAMLLPALWLLGCPLLIAILDLSRHTNQLTWIKYSLLAGPAVYLILPMLLDGKLKHLLPAAAVIYCAVALPQVYDDQRSAARSDFKSLAGELDSVIRPNDVVLFAGCGWGDWYTGALYMGVERYARRMPESVVLLKNPVSPKLSDVLQSRRCWMVMSYTSQTPQFFLPDWSYRKVDTYPNLAMLYELIPPGPINVK